MVVTAGGVLHMSGFSEQFSWSGLDTDYAEDINKTFI